MLDHDVVHAALADVLRSGDTFADLFAERITNAVYELTDGELRNARVRTEQGVGLRRVRDGTSQYVHTPDLSEAGVRALVPCLRDEVRPTAPAFATCQTPGAERLLAEMLRLAEAALAEARRHSSPRFTTHITTRVVATWQTVLVGRSDGRIVRDQRDHAAIHVEVVLRHERKVRKSRRSVGATHLAGLCQDDSHLAIARQAMEAALLRVEAVEAPSGEMTVILGPGGPAVLLHEACGHALEADIARQASSAYAGCLGRQVAAPIITVIDDPAPSESAALYHFDDEGEPARPTVLIEQGILRNYLYDRRSAGAGRASNGHGRRLSYAYQPLPRMSTTYVAPGESSFEEIVAGTKQGILVQSISGGDTDMGSGRFNLRVDEGYLVENGRITAPILGTMLSGHGPKVLHAIDRVSTDCQFLNYCYLCNKLDQFPLVVSVGQPALRVPQLLVWGG
ncbi:MAG TPA: TldD/PmbA family protein [Ktedonobacteraceae bacterium]